MIDVTKAASAMGHRSAEARAKKWGKQEFPLPIAAESATRALSSGEFLLPHFFARLPRCDGPWRLRLW